MVETVFLHIHEPLSKVLMEIDVDKPMLIAMISTKVVAERSDFGQISRRSMITGQLVFNSSIALEKEAAAKREQAMAADAVIPMKKVRAPYEEAMYNHLNKRTALHRNLKDNTKLYVALDVVPCYQAGTFFNDQGEVLTKEQVTPFLKSVSKGGEVADYSYQLHGLENIGCFALCFAPEGHEAKKDSLKKLIEALEKAGAK